MNKAFFYAVILAGGSGSRLWPLSRQQLPKQFLSLDGDASLLHSTIHRLSPLIEAKDVLIVTQEALAKGEGYHELLPYQKIFEPVGRNTAPAIALAAAYLSLGGEDPIMAVMPADHVIKDEAKFRDCLQKAMEAARKGKLVTFGIHPTRPETGFGYIKAKSEVADGVYAVERFTEKPDHATATQFLEEGHYYWNSGIFVWRASAILEEIRRYLPQVHTIIETIRTEGKDSASFEKAVNKYFAVMPSISIDYGVLEKSAHVCLIPCDMGWNDIGNWKAVHEIAGKDADGNALQGNIMAIDCKNTLIRAEKRLVAAIGVENLCVVETADAVLITHSDESQRVRDVVDALGKRGSMEHVNHAKVKRPWGSFTVLEEESALYKIKRIEVAPNGKLSMQSHRNRSEHWVVVSGIATVTNGDTVTMVKRNESTYIPIGSKHRLENREKEPLHIVEIQVGDYLGEDDIERYEDHYGR